MIKLLSTYSLVDILTIVITLGLAFKGFISFFDWAKDWIYKKFNKDLVQEQETTNVKKLEEDVEQLKKMIDLLMASDKDDIKSYITEKHHYFVYKQKWIDDYSLECLEKRFTHYQTYGGNSFIAHFMDELRALPTKPPGDDFINYIN